MGGGQPGGELPLPLMARLVEGFRASMYASLHSQGGGRVISRDFVQRNLSDFLFFISKKDFQTLSIGFSISANSFYSFIHTYKEKCHN